MWACGSALIQNTWQATSLAPIAIREKVGRTACQGLRIGSQEAAVVRPMSEVVVLDKEIRITGSEAVLARAAAQGLDQAPTGVLSFIQEWRARKERI